MKKIYSALFFLIVIQSLAHANTPARGPSVEPMMEIDIESDKKTETTAGYDFAAPVKREPGTERKRTPANITTKTNATSPYSYIGPFIFLLTLPIGLWIMVSKKFKANKSERPVDYYSKTHQFTPKHSSVEEGEDDDIDYPKAS